MKPTAPMEAGLVRFLKRILESEDQEVVYERGAGWWVGEDRTTGRWPRLALTLALVSPTQDTHVGHGLERYEVNEEGRKLVQDPAYQPELLRHLRAHAQKLEDGTASLD